MSSQGSVSTALAAGSGLPVLNNTKNKIKLDIPPRPAKATTTNRRQMTPGSGKSGGGNANATAVAAGGAQNNDASIPHVVRVTFLGVAGLLAKPLQTKDGSNDAANESSSAEARTTSAASAEHPSLLLPLPPNMRVVASVSRSRTARGIPSGMSKCLSSPNPNNSNNKSGVPPSLISQISPNSMKAIAGSFSHSPVAGDKRQPNNKPGGIDEISITRDQSLGMDSVLDEKNSSANKMEGHRRKGTSRSSQSSSFDPAPPSQLSHSRSRSSSHRGSRLSRSGSMEATKDPRGRVPDEGIEVIRPYSPTEEAAKNKMKGPKFGEAVSTDNDANDQERLVAVWDEKLPKKPPQTPKAAAAGGANNNVTGTQQQQQQYVNLTNSLAFEAELRPSSSVANNVSTDEGRAATPVPSTTFAPKSFCVTLGLVPDFDFLEEGQGASRVLDDLGESQVSPEAQASATSSSSPTPTFAIPVGFADLVINGDETLDGKRKQIDLPLSSLASFIDMFGGNEKVAQKGQYPFPLIELTAEGLANAMTTSNQPKAKEDEAAAKIAATTTGKTKKKSIVKRMFSRKLNQSSPASVSRSETPTSLPPQTVYSGTPRSIYELGRPPNAKERTLFLERYGVDPSGDAVVRIGLEVFPRGSELEKIFRQKNKLRKKAALEAARVAAAGGISKGRKKPHGFTSRAMSDHSNGRFSPSSIGSRTYDTGDSRSLMDDEDEDYLDSDNDDSVFSQSFFTLDSDASRTTWDESTMYTDALSSFNTMDDDDSLSYTTGFTGEFDSSERIRSPKRGTASNAVGGLFASILSCNGPAPMTCGISDEEEAIHPLGPYANIDTVASAMASMSMPDVHEEMSTPGNVSLKSPASMDTATRGNNDHERAISPDNIKESGEELTLDNGKESVSGRRPIKPVDTDLPNLERQMTSVTVEQESTPLCMIKQRFAESQDFEAKERKRQQEEGTEFTLEEHQSWV